MQAEKIYPEIPAFFHKKSGDWNNITYAEYAAKAKQLAKGLIASGVKRNDKIATFSNNRPEWNILDMAIAMCGAIHVPVFPNYNNSDLLYILEHTEITRVFVSNKTLYNVVSNIADQIDRIKEIYLIESSDSTICLDDIYKKADEISEEVLEKLMTEISINDIVSIYYTSGTGGKPKGAMVMHQNIVEMVKSMAEIYFLNKGDKTLSYLPLSHSFESAHSYIYQFSGVSVYYAESVASVEANLTEVRPVMFLSVPQLLEKVHASIRNYIENSLESDKAEEAYQFAINYHPENKEKIYIKQYKEFYNNFYCHWKEKFCGDVKRISAGGAALPEYLTRLFFAFDIFVLEVYGLTETYAVAVNSLQHGYKIGTVGVPDKNVEVKIAEDGEILCRSPYIIKGYYKDEEQTQLAFDSEGYFHTGDLGEWIEDKFIKITGRKRDVFKVASGIFISPEVIEKQLRKSPYISNVLIVGKDKEFLSAVIVPDFDALTDYCLQKKYNLVNWKILLNDLEIKALFQQSINEYNRNVWGAGQILKFKLIEDKWSVQSGEMTPTMKLKRQYLTEKYVQLINEFYNL